ncbi:MAG: serine/threonine protein kinase [Flavisolibacter sp.]|nr:serine/threonine protein kinase [Flavisolibacter sp.]
MVKYKLSGNVSITDVADYDYEDIPPRYLQGHYVLYDGRRDKEFLINETVKYFIDKFSFAKTPAEVLKEVENDVQSSSREVEETCLHFFKFLSKKKILVPENEEEAVVSEDPLFKEGDYIGHLRISEILSSRRYTDVYLAVDETDQSVYVIKLLNPNKMPDAETFEQELVQLESEYVKLESLKHIPFISRAYAFGKQDQYAYIVLEYVRGKSLNRFIRETEALTENDSLQIIENVLRAFSLLHQNDLIHGDVHSSNVLVAEDRNVKIIDLGLSRQVELDANKVLKFGGVDYYMPPERIDVASVRKFTKEPDFYSDVYQIGLLIYLVSYKTLPFRGFIWEELAQNIKEGKATYPDTSFLNYPVSQDLIGIMKKCLNVNPAERYRDATAILNDFKKYVFAEERFVN